MNHSLLDWWRVFLVTKNLYCSVSVSSLPLTSVPVYFLKTAHPTQQQYSDYTSLQFHVFLTEEKCYEIGTRRVHVRGCASTIAGHLHSQSCTARLQCLIRTKTLYDIQLLLYLTIKLKSAGPTPTTTIETGRFPTSINLSIKLSTSLTMPSTITSPIV